MFMSIKTAIDNISQNDYNAMKSNFTKTLNEKAYNILDEKKKEISTKMFKESTIKTKKI